MYIHHTPGRLRIRLGVFHCTPAKTAAASQALRALEGVAEVAVNPKAGSLTIHFDPARQDRAGLLAALAGAGCLAAPTPTARPRVAPKAAREVGSLFGKALVGALAQRTAQTLVGALL